MAGFMFTDWLHRLLNPHCEECLLRERERLEREAERATCKYCDFLKLELAKEQERSRKLLDSILTFQEEAAKMGSREASPFPAPIEGLFKPWHVRQRELEKTSRDEALRLKEAFDKTKASSASTEQLEKELLDEKEAS